MEVWDAYTKSGVLTSKKLIRGEAIPDDLYHMVCEVLVQHEDGSYLCMKRSASKHNYPGYYEATAGGSALQGENKYQCIARELYEETGLICDSFTEIGCFIYDDDHCIFHCFICQVNCDKNAIKLQAKETDDYKWMPETDFIKFINSDQMIPNQKQRYMKYFMEKNYIN
ncbi:MAG: NUDIX domain-containing protein [Lachnospiraceae bacterium]|nr:NUDIX domain-containing protein [Lachnospiraceae bacterium]